METNQQQLSARADEIRKTIRQLELQCEELDLLVLKTPTGYVRNQICDALIYLRQGINELKEVC